MTQPDLLTHVSASEQQLDPLQARLDDGWVKSKSFSTKTGTVDLFRPTTSDESPLMIKQSPRWGAAHARGMWMTLAVLRSYADRTGLAPFAAAPRHWGSDPAYICSDWVEGRDMTSWFAATYETCEPGEAFRRSLEMSRRYASLLAHYHHAMSDMEMLADEIPRKSKTIEQAGFGVRIVAMLRGGRGVSQAERVRSIDDPGPHNSVEAPDGSLWLIDLPAHFHSVMVERDIARFVSRQVGAVRKHARSSWFPRLWHYRRIANAVVDGYESVGSPGSTSLDLPLVYACLAADAAVKTARTRKRLAPGVRLEAFVREALAMSFLGIGALWLRVRQPAAQPQPRSIDNAPAKISPG